MTSRFIVGSVIVTVAVAVNLRELSRRLNKGDCGGLYFTPLVTIVLDVNGNDVTPANAITSHYGSFGHFPLVYAQTLASNTLLYTRAKKAWEDDGDVFPFTQTQVTNALGKCDVSTDDGWTAMARMGVKPQQVVTL